MQPNTVKIIVSNAITQCKSISITLDTGSHPPEDSDSPTPKSRGATMKFKKSTASSKRNLRAGMLILHAHDYTR